MRPPAFYLKHLERLGYGANAGISRPNTNFTDMSYK
jgi:hypothetical protein